MGLKRITTSKKITDRSSESFNLYLKDLLKLPVLTDPENVELCLKAQKGDEEARNKLVTGNLRFVITCAKHFQGQGLELSDLVAEGNFGLFKSIDSYDPAKGVKFMSYAVNWIEQSILEAIYHTGKTIRIPVSHLNDCRKVSKTYAKYEQEYECEGSVSDIAEKLNMSEKKVNKILRTPTSCASLDAPIESKADDVTSLLDLIPNNYEDTDFKVLSEELHNKLFEALHCLSPRSRSIIQMFYGISVENRTLEEIGKYFGLTSERIRQLKDEALIELNQLLKQKGINY